MRKYIQISVFLLLRWPSCAVAALRPNCPAKIMRTARRSASRRKVYICKGRICDTSLTFVAKYCTIMEEIDVLKKGVIT